MKTIANEVPALTETEKIGAVCRGLRAMHGMSQGDLAERMGITKPTVSAIESGETTAAKYLTKMCQAFHVKLGDVDLLMDLLVNSLRRSEEVSHE